MCRARSGACCPPSSRAARASTVALISASYMPSTGHTSAACGSQNCIGCALPLCWQTPILVLALAIFLLRPPTGLQAARPPPHRRLLPLPRRRRSSLLLLSARALPPPPPCPSSLSTPRPQPITPPPPLPSASRANTGCPGADPHGWARRSVPSSGREGELCPDDVRCELLGVVWRYA